VQQQTHHYEREVVGVEIESGEWTAGGEDLL
jgi:hypothetical protein